MHAGDLGRTHAPPERPRVATESDSPAVAPVFFVVNSKSAQCLHVGWSLNLVLSTEIQPTKLFFSSDETRRFIFFAFPKTG